MGKNSCVLRKIDWCHTGKKNSLQWNYEKKKLFFFAVYHRQGSLSYSVGFVSDRSRQLVSFFSQLRLTGIFVVGFSMMYIVRG